MATKRICSIPDCGKPTRGHGLCNAHLLRKRRHGDPLAGRTAHGVPLRYLFDTVLKYEGDECLFWPYSRITNGYATVDKDGKTTYVHRLVCELAHGPAPTDGHQAAHSCGRGHDACVTKGHLSWKTQQENEADKVDHGTHQFGERNQMAKLTEQKVREIRALRGKMIQREIAELYGVSTEMVSNIQLRKNWTLTA